MREPGQQNPLAFLLTALLAVAVLLMLFNVGINLPAYLEVLTTRADHPGKPTYPAYARLLEKFARGGYVDYAGAKNSAELRLALDELKRTGPNCLLNSDEQLAYWSNAYNLLSIKNIADRAPIRNLAELHESRGVRKFVVGGQLYTIKEIDEERIRPLIMSYDWRGLFAVCPGAMGYPRVPNRPFSGATLNEDLARALKNFVLRSDTYLMEEHRRVVRFSPFYRWNGKVIDGVYDSPLLLLNSCLPDDQKFEAPSWGALINLPFDWRINDIALSPRGESDEKRPSSGAEGDERQGPDAAVKEEPALDSKADLKADSKPNPKSDPKPDAKADQPSASKEAPEPDPKSGPRTDTPAKTRTRARGGMEQTR